MEIPRRVINALGFGGSIALGLIIGLMVSAAQIDYAFLAEQTAALSTIAVLMFGIAKAFKGASFQSMIVLGLISSAQLSYWITAINPYIVGSMIDVAIIAAAYYIYGFRRHK